MSFISKIKYYFRKHSFFRAIVVIGVIFAIFSFFAFLFSQDESEPIIFDINPAVGESGDIMTITGNHFGERTVGSTVEIGGMQLTSSSYLLWSNDEIKVVLPHNIADGLVYVETHNGKSNPSVFANRETIPVPIAQNTRAAMPTIESIQASRATIGTIITIDGSHFGATREGSQVLFTLREPSINSRRELIACSEYDKDYQFWSDNQLQVRIPDGAITGHVYVRTSHGTSNGVEVSVLQTVGSKTYEGMRSYIVNINADITEVEAQEHATLTLFMPMPITTIVQREVEVLSSEPTPRMSYSNNFVHQISQNEVTGNKIAFSHSFSVDVYGVRTNVNVNSVGQYSDDVQAFYSEYLRPDSIVPSDSERVIELVAEIIGRETNPWRKAQFLYDWIIDSIEILPTLRSAESPVLNILDTNTSDAYEIAIVYTAFLRAAGIPAITNAGILVNADLESQNHWWCEFYIEGLGWVPVDPALGADLEYNAFQKPEDVRDFYFGNIDSQHITFSRGWNNMSQTQITGKKVYRPKTYALQAIWEESTEGIIKYSSYWQNARVMGVY